jgi:hypothetical protein
MGAVAPYIQQSTHRGSTDGVWWVGEFWRPFWCWFGARLSRSLVGLDFHSNYPILTHFCLLVSSQTLQNIRVWLLEGASSVTLRFGWRFIVCFSIYRGIFGTKKWVATKKLFTLKLALQFDALAPYFQQSTRKGSVDWIWWVLADCLV